MLFENVADAKQALGKKLTGFRNGVEMLISEWEDRSPPKSNQKNPFSGGQSPWLSAYMARIGDTHTCTGACAGGPLLWSFFGVAFVSAEILRPSLSWSYLCQGLRRSRMT